MSTATKNPPAPKLSVEDRSFLEGLVAVVTEKPAAESRELCAKLPPDQAAALIAAGRSGEQAHAQVREILGLPPAAGPAPPVPKAARKLRVFAGPCEQVPTHKRTRVYKTLGQVRFCVCDDCGHTWKKTGPEATEAA